MFRRTLLLFAGFVLLVLALTVGYALLGLSGPRTAIDEADHAYAGNRLTEAIRLLDLAERTLTAKEHAELQPAILRRRFTAHRRLGNITAARRDLEALLALIDDAPVDPRLSIERAELLLLDDQPEAALQEATRLLELPAGAERPRTLELAGEAHQKLYQRGMAKLVAAIEHALPGDSRQRAIDLLKQLLYRERSDLVAQEARQRLLRQLREEPATPVSVDDWQRQLDQVQAGIGKSLAFFRRAMECEGGKPSAAYRGLLFAMEQSGRHDDAQALTRLYLERYRHGATVDAAVDLATEALAAGNYPLVLSIAEPHLPPGLLVERASNDLFTAGHRRLLVALARSLYALRDRGRLGQLAQDMEALWQSKRLKVLPESRIVSALNLILAEDKVWPKRVLQWFLEDPASKTITAPGYDLFAFGAQLMLQVLRDERAPNAELDAVFDAWCQARAAERAPLQARLAHLVATERLDAALALAGKILERQDRTEGDLRTYVDLADKIAAKTDRSAASLLAQVAARPTAGLPEPQDPAIWLQMGELALARNAAWLAQRCGQIGARTFSWSEWPRRLQVEGALGLDMANEALHGAEVYRKLHPHSPEALRLYRAALAKLGRSDPSLLFDVALEGAPDADLAQMLIDRAVARDQRTLLTPLCNRCLFRFGSQPRVVLAAAKGLLAAGELPRAREILLQLPSSFPTEREVCIEAASRFLELEAKAAPSSPLLGVATQTLLHHAKQAPDTLLEVATELERAGQPALALSLIEALLEPDADRGKHAGRLYTLAGRLCLALDQEAKAEEHLTAAIPNGGDDAIQPLALLWLRQGRIRDAKSALWQTEATDEVSACLMLNLEQPESATRWARTRLFASPLDVVPAIVLALSGSADDRRLVPADFHNLVRADRQGTLAAITQLSMPGFQRLAERSTKQLRQIVPKNNVAWFLHARALARAGQLDAAVAELTALVQAAPGFLPAYDEVLRITDGGMHRDVGKLGIQLSNSILMAPSLATPRMVSMAGHALATHMSASGADQGAALELLTHLWLRFPAESSASMENVATLTARGRTREAFALLARIEARVPPSQRSRFLDFYFLLGQQIAKAGDAKLQAELDAKAQQVVAEEGAFGAAVHHLLDALERAHGPLVVDGAPAPHAAEARRLLHAHLGFVPELRELGGASGQRSIRRLASFDSPATILEAIDALLRRDPTLLPIWIERARLLEARGDYGEAVASLNWVFAYVVDDAAALELARIVGEHDLLDAAGRGRLRAEFPATLQARADAAYPLGLLALRDGELETAARLLEAAQPRPDGGHLYFRAHTALRRGLDPAAARAAFAELAERYPTSPHHVNARHFAAQLALLENTAPPNGPR